MLARKTTGPLGLFSDQRVQLAAACSAALGQQEPIIIYYDDNIIIIDIIVQNSSLFLFLFRLQTILLNINVKMSKSS